MYPLCLLNIGQDASIERVKGSDDIRQHLADLGFIQGQSARLIARHGGNLIVQIKQGRVAISRELAQTIFMSERDRGSHDAK